MAINNNSLIDNNHLFLLQCPQYEDYVDTLIEKKDLKYIRNIDRVRDIVQLGFHSTNIVLSPEQYQIYKDAAKHLINPSKKGTIIFSQYIKITDPVLQELQSRERPNVQKFLSTILFVCYKLKSGYEISGYIDYEHCLRETNRKVEGAFDWHQIFINKKLIKPRITDLSFCNWKTNQIVTNNSDNYVVFDHPKYDLSFMHKGDRKIISVSSDPPPELSENYIRTSIYSPRFGYVIFYDHIIRRKL